MLTHNARAEASNYRRSASLSLKELAGIKIPVKRRGRVLIWKISMIEARDGTAHASRYYARTAIEGLQIEVDAELPRSETIPHAMIRIVLP